MFFESYFEFLMLKNAEMTKLMLISTHFHFQVPTLTIFKVLNYKKMPVTQLLT
jgi:hypothetical protein